MRPQKLLRPAELLYFVNDLNGRVNRLVEKPKMRPDSRPSSTIDAGYGPSSASACFVSSQRSVIVPCFNPSPTTRWTLGVKIE